MSAKHILHLGTILCLAVWTLNARGDPSSDKFLIIVSNPLHQTGLITASLNTYQQDLQAEGWATILITINTQPDPGANYICPDEVALKALIADYYAQGYDGFVLIGSPPQIPVAWWKWKFSDYYSDPTDLFYADMDEWPAKDGNVYTSYDAAGNFVGSNFGPEMFFGRISAGPLSANLTGEAEKVAAYLDKIHAYRANNGNLTPEQQQRAFIFRDDDYCWKNRNRFEPLSLAAANIDAVLDPPLTHQLRLAELLEAGYRFGEIWAHSGADFHQLREWDGDHLIYNNDFNVNYLSSLDAKVNCLNLFACSALRYTEVNFGAAYIFNTAKTGNVSGSSGGWGIGLDSLYYAQLNDGVPIGIAFRDIANRQVALGEEGWPKGILAGDPLLRHSINLLNRPPRIVNDLPQATALPNCNFSLTFLTADPEHDPVTVTIDNLPPEMTLSGNRLSWTPGTADRNSYRNLRVKASDNQNHAWQEDFQIHVYAQGLEVLANGDFENGNSLLPDQWFKESFRPETVLQWEPAGASYNGTRCVSIDAAGVPTDASWVQSLPALKTGAWYLLQAWVKGEDIQYHQAVEVGANLCMFGTWYHSSGCGGSFDWMLMQYKFQARPEFQMAAGRLGYWSGTVTGKAWFDDIALYELLTVPQNAALMLADGDIEITKAGYSEGNIHSNHAVRFAKGLPSTHRGDVSAVEEIYFGKQMTLEGNLTAPEVRNYGIINGTINRQAVTPQAMPAAPSYSFNTDDREIRNTAALVPGMYGEIIVRKRATLNLSAGSYYLRRLEIHKDAAVNADVSGGQIDIFIAGDIEFIGEGTLNALGASAPGEQVTIWSGDAGTLHIRKYSILNACNLYAPEARVEFAQNSFFKGFICAREIAVQRQAVLVSHLSGFTPQNALLLAAAAGEDSLREAAPTGTIPGNYELDQNFPNPFNPNTVIAFSLPEAGPVTLKLYNIRGQWVETLVEGYTAAGRHQAAWDGRDHAGTAVSSGVYFCRLTANGFTAVRKLVLIR